MITPEPGRAAAAHDRTLDAAERRGMSLPWRAALVLLAEAGLAYEIWQGHRSSFSFLLAGFVVPGAMALLGLLLTVQAHHRVPVAWHVIAFFGFVCSFALVLSTTFGGQGLDTASGPFFDVLAVYSAVTVQITAVLALARPAGTSYLTVTKVRQADAP